MSFTGVHLAQPYTPSRAVFPARVEPKIDGYRLIAHVRDGTVTFYTRNGHSQPYTRNLGHIAAVLAKKFRNVAVDGEIQRHSWRGSGLIKREHPTTAEKADIRKHAIFYVFDMVPLTGHTDMPLSKRRLALEKRLKSTTGPVRLLPQWTAKSSADVERIYKKMLASRHEGVMVKDPNAGYVPKRTRAWLKKKPVKDMDVVVVGVQKGSAGGKYARTLGALKVRNAAGRVFTVSGGIKDAQRKRWWKNPKLIVGKKLELTVAKTDVSQVWHPRIKRIRGSE